jgi:hypothetical protein
MKKSEAEKLDTVAWRMSQANYCPNERRNYENSKF